MPPCLSDPTWKRTREWPGGEGSPSPERGVTPLAPAPSTSQRLQEAHSQMPRAKGGESSLLEVAVAPIRFCFVKVMFISGKFTPSCCKHFLEQSKSISKYRRAEVRKAIPLMSPREMETSAVVMARICCFPLHGHVFHIMIIVCFLFVFL